MSLLKTLLRLKIFFKWQGEKKAIMSLILFNIAVDVLANAIWQEKKKNCNESCRASNLADW
jgi:hypothetical protein